VVLWTRLLGLWLLLQGQTVLPAGTLTRADHAVDLLEALQGATQDTHIEPCIIYLSGNIFTVLCKNIFIFVCMLHYCDMILMYVSVCL